ncbi:tRNA 2-selenouridine(34) synthase MnmH [Rhodohalobacter sp.]|uniref:tRNA 2-selenouridine(34) synthase MnmH n=1 Tax=Rhodohalobacter sp. TaxID=1974210 RepID=UPI002ACE71D1|nr:tRNA 2-selenouridine(34) synthase MnmH [Rhodohalobacter sp.]MDZ7756525.1 tRNA 2-selenouridine(34) synthase MnmH [Rhodohalobacter sp.]
MISDVSIKEALESSNPIIDVRSPGEFESGHIPGATNIPLFSDEERAEVGTVYKQKSKEEATELGYSYVKPKLQSFITRSRDVAPDGNVTVHCWRGGMRSQAFGKHLTENGFENVRIVTGGYKAYRNYVLSELGRPIEMNVLGGYTGSGKTYVLHELKKLGEQVVDLEGLANHKGSAFGGIDQGKQPTVEQFENNLHMEISKLDRDKPIWVEDESHNIGAVKIPMPFFDQKRNARLYFADIPKKERARHLVSEYAVCNNDELANSIHRISKRLGGLREKKAINFLKNENYFEVAMITLAYYDKYYLRSMERRDSNKVIHIKLPEVNHRQNAVSILNKAKKYEQSKTDAV